MRHTTILGPVTGATYPAYDTGARWNGAPVIGFRVATMLAFIRAGDGVDANGEGIQLRDGLVFDRSADEIDGEPVPVIVYPVDGEDLPLYLPSGRCWEETTAAAVGYGPDDTCRACGAHLADPHGPACPAERIESLRDAATTHLWAHRTAVASGGYQSLAPTGEVDPTEPVQVSHALMEALHRVAADVLEIDLDTWPTARRLIDLLVGDVSQWA